MCQIRKNDVSTSGKVDDKLHITEWNSYFSSVLFLPETEACCDKIQGFVEYTPK